MDTIKIFLASSEELANDRIAFQILIQQINQDWIFKGIFFHLVIWEDFIDALSKDGLQSEYNKAICESDIFVLLFFTKVGKYTKEEFESAFGAFKNETKPIIYTYFKDDLILTSTIGREIISLIEFKETLKDLGHYYTRYRSIEDLKWQFGRQLEKLFTKNEKSSLEISTKSTQSEIDTVAFALTNKALTESNYQVDKQKLNNAISKASDITKHSIYLLASKVRKDNWQYNKDIMERSIPIFEALIECDARKEKHYYFGQLGYALKDKRNPEWEQAKKLFDIAINIIGTPEDYFTYYYYDFNRALCTIKTDGQFLNFNPSDSEVKEAILKDLKSFKTDFEEHFDDILKQESNKVITKWLRLNNVKEI